MMNSQPIWQEASSEPEESARSAEWSQISQGRKGHKMKSKRTWKRFWVLGVVWALWLPLIAVMLTANACEWLSEWCDNLGDVGWVQRLFRAGDDFAAKHGVEL